MYITIVNSNSSFLWELAEKKSCVYRAKAVNDGIGL